MPPVPTRPLISILREFAAKDAELGKLLFPAEGSPRGFLPEGRFKLEGAPVLTAKTVTDRASAAKLLQLAKTLENPAEAQKVKGLASTLLANLEARQAGRANQPLELFSGKLGEALGARNVLTQEQILGLVKEAMSNPAYRGPSFEESMRMAKGNPLMLMLPPNVVRGAQRRAVMRAVLPAAREAAARGKPLPIPSRKSRLPNPEETIKEMRETGEGGGQQGKYAPALPEKQKLERSEDARTKATLSDLLPNLKYEARGGKIYLSWRGQEPVTIQDAIKLTAKEPYTNLLLQSLAPMEAYMAKLPTPSGREATPAQAKRLRAQKRYVEDPTKPTGHSEKPYLKAALKRERTTEGVEDLAIAEAGERTTPAEERERLRKWRTGEASRPKSTPAKAATAKQLELLAEKLYTQGNPALTRFQRDIAEGSPIGPLFPFTGMSANEAGKLLNRAIINETMAKVREVPRKADIRAAIGSKQRIAARNEFARALEEAAQQRGSAGRQVLAEALDKAFKQRQPRSAAAQALLGVRGMKQLGIEDAQAQLIDALLKQPGGARILNILANR